MPRPDKCQEPVVACMATMPSRQDFLPAVVASLANQIDQLLVYCNYPADESIPEVLNQPWIHVQGHGETDLGCTGRIFLAENIQDGYVFW